MKRDYLNNNHLKDKKEFISVGLLGASAVMLVLMVIKVTGFLAAPINAENSLNKAAALSKLDDEEVKKHIDVSKSIADELKKKNLFAPPPQKKHPVNQVLGILGGEALINGKWYKAGDRVGDANIVAIEPTKVVIEWDGNEKTFLPIDAKTSAPSGPRRPGGPDRPQVAKEGEQGKPESVQVQLEVRSGEGMGRFEGGGEMFERMRAMRERFENMSPEERERFRSEMRDRFGGGRGPRGEGGFGGRRGGRGGR